jgi:uncharacterized protein
MVEEQGGRAGATGSSKAKSPDPLADLAGLEAAGGEHSVDERMAELERELLQENRSLAPFRAEPPAQVGEEKPRRKAKQEESSESFDPMSLIFGLVLTVAGAYLIMQRVTIYSGAYYWNRWGGQEAFGLTLIPLLIGIGLLVYGKQLLGWALTGAGSLIILLGILANMQMMFRPATLYEVILMFGMLVAGLGLSARSLRTR